MSDMLWQMMHEIKARVDELEKQFFNLSPPSPPDPPAVEAPVDEPVEDALVNPGDPLEYTP